MDPPGLKRRLTCILAADAVGYSRLVSEDEGNALRVLAAHRAVIDGILAFHDGRIVSTAGDSVLAEFHSVVEAVRCAVEVQDALKTRNEALPDQQRMLFRIGINLGDVVVKGEDLLGDGVNVAARLESLAEPGGILISSSVYDQITGKLDLGFQDMGEQALKNISRPIRAFRVSGAGGTIHAPAPPPKPQAAVAAQPRRLGPIAIVAIVLIGAAAVLAVTQGWLKPPSPPEARTDPAKAKLEADLAAAQQARAEAEAATVKAKAEAEAAATKAKAESEAAATKAKAQADAAAMRSQATADANKAKAAAAPAPAPAAPSSPVSAPSPPVSAPAQAAPSPPVSAPAPPPAAPAVASAKTRYDGNWAVTQHCSAVGNATPFTRNLIVAVTDGEFVFERGVAGQPGSYAARGRPAPDGTLVMTGTGVSPLQQNYGQVFDVRFEGIGTNDRFMLRGKLGGRTCRIEMERK